MPECNKSDNMTKCTCTYEPCPRKGVCCECIMYHRAHGELPGCLFTEKTERTYDRSIARFIEDQRRQSR